MITKTLVPATPLLCKILFSLIATAMLTGCFTRHERGQNFQYDNRIGNPVYNLNAIPTLEVLTEQQAKAVGLIPNQKVIGQLSERLSGSKRGEDQDYYNLDINKDQYVLIQIEGPENTDFDLSVLNSNLEKIAFSTEENSFESVLVHLPKGRYEIEIEEWNGRGQYELTIVQPNRESLNLSTAQHLYYFQSDFQQYCEGQSARNKFQSDINQSVIVDTKAGKFVPLSDWLAGDLNLDEYVNIETYTNQQLTITSKFDEMLASESVSESIYGGFNIHSGKPITGSYSAEALVKVENQLVASCIETNTVYDGARIL